MIPSDLSDSDGNGEWAGVVDWPLLAIHAQVLPDGRILTFGTDENGMQGGQFIYDVYDPVTGEHTTLPNTTGTDIFCSNIALDPYLDFTLMVGGDNRPNGEWNQSIVDVTAFDYETQTIFAAPEGDLNSARWYPGILTLGSGDIITIAGREDHYNMDGTNTPGNDTVEMYRSGLGWDVLEGTQSDRMGDNKWYYPDAWLKSDGTVIMVEPNSNDGGAFIWSIDVEGEGGMTQIGNLGYDLSNPMASINHRTDKSLIMDTAGRLLEFDFSGDDVVVSVIDDLGDQRRNGDMSILADGRVAITGGTAGNRLLVNGLEGANKQVVIYDPDTGSIEYGEEEGLARLYHSITTLTRDGTLLSAGGGSPGPLTNLNAELWAPDYMFDDTGALADRMEVAARDDLVNPGEAFVIDTDGTEVTKVTAIRSGSVTHGSNMDGRFLELEYREIADGKIEVQTPPNANVMVPGTWMVFVFDDTGVPAIAEMLDVDPGAMTKAGDYVLGTSTYALADSNLSFAEAQAQAAEMGGQLVQIDSAEEANFLAATFGDDVEFHLRDAPATTVNNTLSVVEFEDARSLVAQTGEVIVHTTGDDDWLRVDFDYAMDDAVVVVSPPTYDGTHPGTIRVRNVDDTGFELQFEEWEYTPPSHLPEAVEWIAVERGVHVLDDGAVIEAGISVFDHNATDVSFSTDFGAGGAVVMGQIGSHYGGDTSVHRIYEVTETGFTAELDEEEAKGAHMKEDLHWIAFEGGNHNAFSAFVDENAIDSETDGTSAYAIDAARSSNSDVFFADFQSLNGRDTAALRLISGEGETPVLKLEEEASRDTELAHTLEDLAWVYTDELIFA